MTTIADIERHSLVLRSQRQYGEPACWLVFTDASLDTMDVLRAAGFRLKVVVKNGISMTQYVVGAGRLEKFHEALDAALVAREAIGSPAPRRRSAGQPITRRLVDRDDF